MKKFHQCTLFFLFFGFCSFGFSQNSNLYMPKEIKQAYKKETRSWDGNPGKNYWQNFSEYDIEAEFIPDSCLIVGHEVIKYYNNSPDTLTSLVLMLKQNLYQKGGMRDYPIQLSNVNDGVKVNSVVINDKAVQVGYPQTAMMGTRFYIGRIGSRQILPSTETRIEISWELTMPKQYEIRTGRANDSAFFIGYWFPQIVVYDDIFGWDKMFYSGVTETYNDNSDFNVKLKIPGEFLVWATGELQNPYEIYTSDFYKKIEKSKHTDEVIHVITEDNAKSG